MSADVTGVEPPTSTFMVLPSGSGLHPLPSSLWNSAGIRQAVSHGHPGHVVAAARRAHGLRQEQLGALAGFSQSAISRLESGGNLAYDIRVLRIFQRLLGIPPHLLGLTDGSVTLRPRDAGALLGRLGTGEVLMEGRTVDGSVVSVAIDRHTLMATCAAFITEGVPVASLASLDIRGPVDSDLLRRLRVVRRLLNDADSSLGPRNLLPAVGEVYDFVERLRRSASGELRREILGIMATYADFSGWLHEQAGDLDAAREWTDRALQQAQASEDRDLVAYVYIRMSQFGLADKDDDRVIGLAHAALREGSPSLALRAMALRQEARGHALAGDAPACLAKFDEARTATLDLDRGWTDEYRVGAWFGPHHVDAQKAACLLDLGMLRQAIETYEDGEAGRGALCQWEQALHTVKLARAHAASGDVERAVALATDAVETNWNLGSAVVQAELRTLEKWRHVPAMATLLDAAGGHHSAPASTPTS